MEILDPLAESAMKTVKINEISNVNTVSLVDNTKPNADIILKTIEKFLEVKKTLWVRKPAGAPANEKQIKNMEKGDLCILAVGDCGSCTTWLILDAIKLEKRGIPTISICSSKFKNFAENLAKAYGAKNLRILDIPHPIAGKKKEEIKKEVKKIIPKLNKLISQQK
ncbi:conserved hypothetical protein [Methanothermus fervidus DSM 2088]|uniref:UGSC-like domain-containing protein n=1 Tax=Methanothermus fervidus (strain ATCC 43054 / DSM 2088 / JCM 10308 / V24 S) TaxID=523846 RepID=E3GXF7_METFV|nr:UGSC family (seleno)protein [Methanothermus fervidus]ADP76989.1 conserved hypothetical protein [Methanothermus fervidus DSM 2088]